MLNTGSAIRSESKKSNMNNYIIPDTNLHQNNLHTGGNLNISSHNLNISSHNLNPFASEAKSEIKHIPNAPQNTLQNALQNAQQNAPQNAVLNQNTIMMEVKDGKFLFNDNNRVFLGSFTGEELVKYVICKSAPSFLPNINSSNSKEIIEKYICKVDLDQPTDNTKYHIINHLDSPFTGHVEMLVKLYKQIDEFEQTRLTHELSFLPENDAGKAKKAFYSFILVLLSHILKIISILSEIIKPTSEQHLNNKLLKYSVSIMHKISTVTKNQISDRLNMIDSLLAEKQKIYNIQQILSNKIEDLEEAINEQDIKINALHHDSHMTGGAKSESSTQSESSTTSEGRESTSKSKGRAITTKSKGRESTSKSEGIASSSSNINNMTDILTESTTLSDILNNRHKLKYSTTSTFNSDDVIRDSILNTRTSDHKKREDTEYSYLISNDSTSINKIIDI